jgi:hypothetical protein
MLLYLPALERRGFTEILMKPLRDVHTVYPVDRFTVFQVPIVEMVERPAPLRWEAF